MTPTPKNLMHAIDNGVLEYNFRQGSRKSLSPWACNELIEKHVRDFLNQKLGVLMLSENPEEVKAAEKMQKLLMGEEK